MYTDQPSPIPTEKVQAQVMAGSATIILIYLAKQFNVELPAEVASAIVVLVSFIASYFTKNKTINETR